MNTADRGKMPVAALPRGDDDLPLRFVENRHVDGLDVAPETEQGDVAVLERRGQNPPETVIDEEPRIGPVQFDEMAGSRDFGECGHLSCHPIRAGPRRAGTKRPAAAAGRHPPSAPVRDGRPSAHKTPAPERCCP